MGVFSIFSKKQNFFSQEENQRLVAAIRSCENRTSGEIRVFIESKNPLVSALERARDVFFALKMENTHHRNAVLLYIAHKHHEVALFADEGIYRAVGREYWENEIKEMLVYFKDNHLADGIEHCIRHIGDTLSEKFPYLPDEDKNELPDEIVFGK